MRKLFLLAFLAIFTPHRVVEAKNYEFNFIRTEKMNDTDDLFKYNIKSVEKIEPTVFKVNAESDLFVELTDEWHMWIQVFHNAEGKEEFGEKPFLSVPKKAFCQFWGTTYKERLWTQIKDYSNLPSPEQCPIKPDHFVITDYPFDMSKYASLARPGLWRIDMFVSQDHEDSHITKIGVSMFSSVTEVKEE